MSFRRRRTVFLLRAMGPSIWCRITSFNILYDFYVYFEGETQLEPVFQVGTHPSRCVTRNPIVPNVSVPGVDIPKSSHSSSSIQMCKTKPDCYRRLQRTTFQKASTKSEWCSNQVWSFIPLKIVPTKVEQRAYICPTYGPWPHLPLTHMQWVCGKGYCYRCYVAHLKTLKSFESPNKCLFNCQLYFSITFELIFSHQKCIYTN